MPCNAIATARARVDNLAQLAEFDQVKLAEMVKMLCEKKFEGEYFEMQLSGGIVYVTGGRLPNEIAAYAKQIIGALAQRAIAAKMFKAARVTGQTTAMNGAMVLEVEL